MGVSPQLGSGDVRFRTLPDSFDSVRRSELPYYCAPLVCVSAVMELLVVWRHNKPKTKNRTCTHGPEFKFGGGGKEVIGAIQ